MTSGVPAPTSVETAPKRPDAATLQAFAEALETKVDRAALLNPNPGSRPFQRLNRAEYARQWKARTGGKVVGYFCTYGPEELMYAANILPVRILGSHEVQDVTEPHIFGMFCPFCRDCLAAHDFRERNDFTP